jgi:hypothetical protein
MRRSKVMFTGILLAVTGVGAALAWKSFAPAGECVPEVHAVVIEAHVHDGKPYSVQMVTTELMDKAPIIALYDGDEPADGCESRTRSALATYTLDEDAGWLHVKSIAVRSLHQLDVMVVGKGEPVESDEQIPVDWANTRW